jgi:flagellar biosynthetic protein FliQ
MTFGDAIELARQAIFVALIVAAPVLIVSLVTGMIISLLQAVTQIQEPTLTFVPKIVVSALAILFFGPFMLAMLTDFATRVISSIANAAH